MDDSHMYLDNIDEFINDQNLIVSYKWLSLTLQVNVNIAKQMLYHYVSKQRKVGKKRLTVTYFICGWQCVDSVKTLKSCIVQEEGLEKAKSLFDQLISLHIYSIQRSKLLDYNALYICDYDKQKEASFTNSHSGIVNSNAKVSPTNSRILKPDSDSVLSMDSTSQPRGKPAPAVKHEASADQNREGKKDSKAITKSKAVGIAAMFTNQSNVNMTPSEERTTLKANKAPKASKGIAGMFVKLAEKSNSAEFKVESEGIVAKTVSPEFKKSETDDKTAEPIAIKVSNKTSTSEKPKSNTKQRSKKKGHPKSEAKKSQVRKRIRVMEPSSSSSSENEEGQEEEIAQVALDFGDDPAEESKTEEIPGKVKVAEQSKNKKRKLVDKTFVEDGFIVTHKVWESYSESESEDVQPKVEPAETVEKSTKPTIAPTHHLKKKPDSSKPKQASLMNFFKKRE